jgi:(S)-2-hydroxyglutarate dehydrogenase
VTIAAPVRTGKRVAVIGGGLVGLGTARALLRRDPRLRVTVIEKEPGPGRHQSTHNSGVLHAGLYYTPGSTKARLAVQGIRSMTAFCRDHGVTHEICGKLVVAVSDDELPRLRTLLERGQANGLQGLQWLAPEEAREIEPHVHCVAAVRVPEEGITDYAAVVDALTGELAALGGEIRSSAPVVSLDRRADGWTIRAGSSEIGADFIVNCAGLHSDRIAKLAGEPLTCRIVPFRGEYFVLRRERMHLVRNLIYPVPDPAFPFLGVHLTRMVKGDIECGPNAVLALAREGYTWSHVSVRDTLDALGFGGLWRFLRRYPRMTWYEVTRSFSKALFTRSLQRLVPEIQEADLAPGGSGVRAQAMLNDGTFVQDFLFVERADALHVLNAPSPAATASLAIGEEICGKVVQAMGG